MDKIHFKALIKCRSEIVSKLIFGGEFEDKVVENEIFTPVMLEMIKAKKSRPERVRKFLNDLTKRGKNAYGKFLACLDSSGQSELADVIREKETSLRYPNINASVNSEPRFVPPSGGYCPTESNNYPRASVEHFSPPNITASGSIVASPSVESCEQDILRQTYNNVGDDVNMENDTDRINSSSEAYTNHAGSVVRLENQPSLSNASERDECYKMTSSPKGYVIVINNQNFQNGKHRIGAERDGQMIKHLFIDLQFKVYMNEDKTAQEIQDILLRFSRNDELHFVDSLIVVLMSHGNYDNLEGIDSDKIKILELVRLFDRDKCPAMFGKPKMFVINACRGDEEDSSVKYGSTLPFTDRIDNDSGSEIFRQLPSNSDLLLAYSTFPGYVSYRDEEHGSWYIENLVDVFREKASAEHVMDMLTMVNRRVAERSELGLNQTPAPTTTLRYKWYLNEPQSTTR